jgi:hypothetical protein
MNNACGRMMGRKMTWSFEEAAIPSVDNRRLGRGGVRDSVEDITPEDGAPDDESDKAARDQVRIKDWQQDVLTGQEKSPE